MITILTDECAKRRPRSPSDSSLNDESSVPNSRPPDERATPAGRAQSTRGKRRFVGPTASDADFQQAELEFVQAMQQYKEQSGRMFPTWSEVLEVLTNLGYQKVAHQADAAPITMDRGVGA